VVADEDSRGEAGVDALHHAERSWPRTDDADVGRQPLDEEIEPVAVRVADENLGRAGLARALDRGEHLGRHELTKSWVLESGRPELVRRYDAGDTLHVGRDVDLEPALREHGRRRDGG
jgi:hypothetical protein